MDREEEKMRIKINRELRKIGLRSNHFNQMFLLHINTSHQIIYHC